MNQMLLLLVVSLAVVAAQPCAVTHIPATSPPSFITPIIDSTSIPKYKTKLPNPLHPSFIHRPDRTKFGAGVDYYEIGMRQFTQQILPPGCPRTTVWGYGDANDPLDNPVSYHSPSKTIVAFKDRPVKIKWNHTQLPSQHLFPIDRSFHCGSAINCAPDVRTVIHLHGAHVEAASDGFPDAWMAPNGQKGTLYEEVYTYDNSQEGATLWYHDHAAGITRLNVYAGLAGFYILRGNREMSLQSLNKLPRYPYDVPIVIQDRSFKADGSLAYPDAPFTAPRLMNVQFGNVFMVNGVAWPKMLVERRKYRLRLLNGCNSRFLAVRIVSQAASNPSVLPIWQVMSDGGLLNGPVTLSNQTIVISPAERIDIVVDFAAAKLGERFELTNNAPTPYPYGPAFPAPGEPMSTIMQFRVKFEASTHTPMTSNPPVVLRNKPVTLPAPATLSSLPVRKLVLADKPYINLTLGFTRLRRAMGTNELGGLDFCDKAGITEQPAVGATEIWEIYNPTGETHPIHLHLVMFQVISFHDYSSAVNPTTGVLQFSLGSQTFPVPMQDQGKKDTVRLDPGRAVRIISTFDRPGLYVWHCHILEHEDYDMMRPICVGGNCPTDWADMTHMPW